MEEKLVVDCAFWSDQYPGKIGVQMGEEYYLLPTKRTSNDLQSFRKISKVEGYGRHDFLNHQYILFDLEKKSGYEFKVGRAISEKELQDLKKSLNLTDKDVVSKPFEMILGGIYGEKYQKKIYCIQLQNVPGNEISIQSDLRKKGIEANVINAGAINIRVNV